MSKNKKHKRLAFIGAITAISILALFLIISNFQDNIVFFYSPSELKNEKILKKAQNRLIRVGGLVKKDSINKINALTTEFTITDLKNDLKIHYTGILPDLFRQEQGVVAKGMFDKKENEFFSKELLIKHDENYMPPEVKNALEK